MRRRAVAAVLAVLVVAGAIIWFGVARGGPGDALPASPGAPGPASSASATGSGDLRALFDDHRSGVEVEGEAAVTRVLPDDDDGSRHQRFILATPDGLTVLVAHNIDIAPRLDGLRVGDRVGFRGEYVWSAQGGTVHWTHHDPGGRHADGWLRWKGRTYG